MKHRWKTYACSGHGRPFTGAWIETSCRCAFSGRRRVAPSRGRGLKPCPACQQSETRGRPFTGAWIETINCAGYDSSSEGRPFTGAWIETPRGKRANPVKPVAPSRGRGLKRATVEIAGAGRDGRPFTGAWIETEKKAFRAGGGQVAPSRGRGLKPRIFWKSVTWRMSPLHGGVD